jgi:hypothetical protein
MGVLQVQAHLIHDGIIEGQLPGPFKVYKSWVYAAQYNTALVRYIDFNG